MLIDKDIGRLFAIMQAAYGNQWTHKADAIPVWLRKLGGFSRGDVDNAANVAIERHKDYPPSLGQFTEIVAGPKPRANTYLPAPKSTKAKALINRILFKVLTDVGGVDKFQLKNLVELKNALLEDIDQSNPSLEWSNSVYKELTQLAEGYDPVARDREREEGRARWRQ